MIGQSRKRPTLETTGRLSGTTTGRARTLFKVRRFCVIPSLFFVTDLIVDLFKRRPDRPNARLSIESGKVRLVSGQSFFLLFRTERSIRLPRSFGQRLQLLIREWKSRQINPLREPSKRIGDDSCFVHLVVVAFRAHGV